ncbi:DUF1217 domain-containing protein [Methylorubrum salsuginis]|uniref:DUF1217 domain-containing protein n=1 Tax=Methylorubrum salsuginis TaxID=414703 RepID=A0A1I4IJS4_9HYPH|nr:DUF1217 domain-containing protein [Methylorubrum salsuginis]SFL54544.1 Protein of unknown function [Methylorubrum salsuginis]
MTDTLTSYRLIAKDLSASLKRKAADPALARETAYYEANISKVKTVDDLMADRRLYTYAMKAYGLEDMTYAKAFMRKVLTEGTGSAASFANRLADERYVAFARAFNFAATVSAAGTDPESFGKAGGRAGITAPAALAATTDFSGANEARFLIESRIDATTTKSVTVTLNAETLAGLAADVTKVTAEEIAKAINAQITASGEDEITGETGLKGKVQVGVGVGNSLFFETTAYDSLGADGAVGGTGRNADVTVYAGGKARTLSIRNVPLTGEDKVAVNVGFGTGLGPDASARTVTDAYLRQALESEAGVEDTGVRLALYFARKAPTISSAYDILGDPALSQVANTVIGLPATSGAATSEALARRVRLISSKIDIPSFQDPAKLDAFVRRFAAIWDSQNNTQSAPVLALFS